MPASGHQSALVGRVTSLLKGAVSKSQLLLLNTIPRSSEYEYGPSSIAKPGTRVLVAYLSQGTSAGPSL